MFHQNAQRGPAAVLRIDIEGETGPAQHFVALAEETEHELPVRLAEDLHDEGIVIDRASSSPDTQPPP
jgi:hypothetical protein